MTTNVTDLKALHGRSVLIKAANDRGNPPAAVRGTLEVRDTGAGRLEVHVAVDLPQMFTSQAQHRGFVLSDAEIERLLGTERGGVFEYTVAQGAIRPDAREP